MFCYFSNWFKKRNETNELYKIQAQLYKIKDEKNINYFSFHGKEFIARPCSIYDGDTFSAIFLYNNEFIKYKCRCMGYDSPEMKPLLNDPNRDKEKELAVIAKNRFTELVLKHETKLVKIKCYEFDKYGRLLVDVWNMVDNKKINDMMIEEGNGKPYFGGKKDKEWT